RASAATSRTPSGATLTRLRYAAADVAGTRTLTTRDHAVSLACRSRSASLDFPHALPRNLTAPDSVLSLRSNAPDILTAIRRVRTTRPFSRACRFRGRPHVWKRLLVARRIAALRKGERRRQHKKRKRRES